MAQSIGKLRIEDCALFALSIAFTASIVAYPDLPDEIPPFNYVGGERAFVGGPLLAFFLPFAALIIWWLLARLNPHPPEAASRSKRAGAATSLFLSAFHVTMLIALIGAQLWFGRILGLMVGIFLIAVRNERPRFGKNPARHKRAVVSVLLFSCSVMGNRVEAQGIPPEKIETLAAFIDATVPKLMEQGHVLGTAVVIVHDGRITFLRGYGKSRLNSDADVDPSHTVFRVGSVTKLFTAAAALQLMEAGKLDLHRDIRDYLPDIPLRYGATTHQLLTHTAGIGEKFAGSFTRSPSDLQPLSDHLRRYARQVIRPGSAYSYSSYNSALTGLLIERLSGLPYERYIDDRILKPLKMTETTAHQPPEPTLSNDLARGYEWVNGQYKPIPYRFTQTGPAGGMSATAADMGRFLLALLGDGAVDGERILSPESVRAMLAPQYTPDSRIPATAYEFMHWVTHGQHLLHKDGTLGDHVSVVLLAPAERFGIFVASNGVPGVGNHLLEPLLTYLVGPSAPTAAPIALSEAPRRARLFAGAYRDYDHTRDDMSRIRALMPMVQSRVMVESDGAIRWKGRRWLEVEPLVFRSENSPDYIVFRQNSRGDITELHEWGGTYQRVGWLEQAPLHLGVLVSCAIAFLGYALSSVRRVHRSHGRPSEGLLARSCAVFVAVANVIFIAGLVISIRDLGDTTPLPLSFVLLLSLPLVSAGVTALLPAFAARAWKDKWWTRRERLGYSTVVIFAVLFMTFLNYWKLLGIRY